ncbi:MAG: ubiquinol-cytochrome c reductase iron-sulfur subunit [Acidimicrobiia bacterium]|nr:ubiquinol-cytochrome c reductase iron-sulfur subunit [Acidimicrobiales bacterium]NNL97329.1 ubiquinol-cytochrome c reductase iron-sulfur subunit [Acidimicrobiia bacterium]
MSGGQAVALGIALVTALLSAGVFTLAWRQDKVSAVVGKMDPDANRAAVRHPQLTPMTAERATAEAPEAAVEEPAPAAAKPVIIELTQAEYGETRRQFLNRATGASFGAFLAFLGITGLAFLWPRLSGGFGSKIDAGDIDEIKQAIFQPDGTIEPFYVAAAKTYVMPFAESEAVGTDFEGLDVFAAGLTGLFQKCVHLGCRVPWCSSSQGFECPCHGSKYNAHGEYEAGPAPRNLDRFALEVVDGRLLINTGQIRDTPRAKVKTVQYPQGVNCV